MKCKALIFDLDNTLTSVNIGYVYNLVRKTIKKVEGINNEYYAVAAEHIIDFWFLENRDEIVVEKLVRVQNYEKFWKYFKEFDTVKERIKATSVFPDVKVVKELKDQGYKIGLVTQSVKKIAKAQVKLIGNNYFHKAISCHTSTGRKSKPDPEGLNECIRRLKVDKENVLYIGDSEIDKKTAANARVAFTLIKRKTYNYPEMDCVNEVNSLHELKELVEILNDKPISLEKHYNLHH